MAVPLRVLILEDRPEDAALELYELRRAGFAPTHRRVESEADYLAALDPALDLILADYALPQFDALQALELLRARGLDIPFIIVSGTIGEEIAVLTIQQGAADYLLKDRLARLGPAVKRALEQRRMRAAVQEAQAALQASARLNQSVLSSLKAEIAVLDQRGTIIAVNAAWAQFARENGDPHMLSTGVGSNYLSVCRRAAQSGLAQAQEALDGLQAILDGALTQFRQEYYCPGPAGARWFVLTATPLADHGGVVVAHEDVTERVQAQQALHAAELKYRTLVEHIPAIIYMGAIDASSTTLYINSQIEATLGFSPSEWLQDPQSWLKRLHPLDIDKVLTGLARAQSGDGPFRSEFRMIARDGRVVWFRDEAVLVRDDAGNPLFLQGVMLDITERKRAEQALQESEERYRLITENSGDLISMTDQEGRVLYASPSYRQLLGYEPADLLGRSLIELVHPDDRLAAQETMLVNSALKPTPIVLRLRHADGSWRWIEGQATAVQRQGQRSYVGIGRDITERRRLEAQFLQAQKMESVGKLAGGVAHDFNNLLTAINGYAELALGELPESAELRSDLEEIIKAADRAAVLTRQLLAFARKQVIEPRVLDLNRLIGEIGKLLHRLLGEEIEVSMQLAPDLSQVRADPGQLEQVLMNLAVNARDAMPNGGTLDISTRNILLDTSFVGQHQGLAPGAYVLLAISDTGSGMDAQTQQHVFEPFFTTKGPGRGTGLGLSTCYGIVKQHGGHIWVASEPGRGTTFTICLPQVSAPAEEPGPQRRQDALPRGSETVLLAEDNAAVRNLAGRLLREQGYTVLEAADGAAALSLAGGWDGPIHLLLTDLAMPHLSGRALLAQLSASRPELKAIFISGYADDLRKQPGATEPDTLLLHKPFSAAQLALVVRQALDTPPAP